MTSDLLGVSEVAAVLGVSRQRVDQLSHSYEDFPVPTAELASGRVWQRRDIDAWIRAHPDRRPGRPSGER